MAVALAPASVAAARAASALRAPCRPASAGDVGRGQRVSTPCQRQRSALRGQPGAVISAVALAERNDRCRGFPGRPPRLGVVSVDDQPIAGSLMPGNTPFRRRVVGEAVVRIEMVLRDQGQHGDPRGQPVLDEGFELPGRELDHDRRLGTQSWQLLERRDAHIPGHDDSGNVERSSSAGEGRNGRLPFRAGDADDRGGAGAEEETHLHLDRDAVRARQLQQRRAPRHTGIADDQIGPLRREIPLLVPAEDETDREPGQRRERLGQCFRGAHVGDGHLGALARQIARHAKTAGAGAEPDEGDAFAAQVVSHVAASNQNWTSAMATPMIPAIMASIQKRIVTCVSDQPSISKW